MNIDTMFTQIKELIHSGAGAKFAFGNPVKVGDLSLLPVARVVFGFGGGGGQSPKQKKEEPDTAEQSQPKEAKENFGGGGGGHIKTEPVGIYTIKGEKIKFYPIVSVREIVTVFGIMILLWYKLNRLRRKKKK
ncbi:MAG: hypothetical protein PWP64_521 [Candidatus Cloacimonadota bacterium]|jgi:uncharacterized spore protein YtfJ|nr:hypothetical protein [Candidatus Cloacimonadota bacterium]